MQTGFLVCMLLEASKTWTRRYLIPGQRWNLPLTRPAFRFAVLCPVYRFPCAYRLLLGLRNDKTRRWRRQLMQRSFAARSPASSPSPHARRRRSSPPQRHRFPTAVGLQAFDPSGYVRKPGSIAHHASQQPQSKQRRRWAVSRVAGPQPRTSSGAKQWPQRRS